MFKFIENLASKFKLAKPKPKRMQVVIGSRTLTIAEPIAARYYALTELLSVPKFETILAKQNELEQTRDKLFKTTNESERQSLQKQMQIISDAIQSEMNKHTFDIERLFKERRYDVLAEIASTICDETVSVEDVAKCYEVELKIAIDFFLAERLRVSTAIAQ
ncbi:MAG: hypothetical protein ACK4XM_12485, partial [Chloroherpetonaceae bacterium]